LDVLLLCVVLLLAVDSLLDAAVVVLVPEL
jgi:hypothetical protein